MFVAARCFGLKRVQCAFTSCRYLLESPALRFDLAARSRNETVIQGAQRSAVPSAGFVDPKRSSAVHRPELD